jgi:hypothetical protein
VGARGQPSDKIRGVLLRHGARQNRCHFGEPRSDLGSLRLIDPHIDYKRGKFACSLTEGFTERSQRCWRVDGQGAPVPELVKKLMNQPHRLAGVLKHQFGKQSAHISVELLPEPVFNDLGESQVGLAAIHHGRTGIDVRFNRVGLDQSLTKAMDGRAGDFVDASAGGRDMAFVVIGKPVGQGDPKFGWNAACRQLADELAHTGEKLAGGEFGEGHRGHGFGRDALCQQQRDAAGHNSSFA